MQNVNETNKDAEIETWHVLHPEREVSMTVFGTKAHAEKVKKQFEAGEVEFHNRKYNIGRKDMQRSIERKAQKKEKHLASLAKKKK